MINFRLCIHLYGCLFKLPAILSLVILLPFTSYSNLEFAKDDLLDSVQIDSSISPLFRIQDLHNKIKKSSSILLHIAENFYHQEFSSKSESKEFVLVQSIDCPIFENQFEENIPLFNPKPNDEFLFLEREESWLKIRLTDGREAWIKEDCVQLIRKSVQKSGSSFRIINERNNQLELANYVLDELILLVEEFRKEVNKTIKKKKITENEISTIRELERNVNKYAALAESAFSLYLKDQHTKTNILSFIEKLSVVAELQIGASDFSMVQNEFSQVEQKGLIGDFIIDLDYQVNDQSRISLGLSNNNDIIQTPFRNTDLRINYQSKLNNLNWNTSASLTRYNDDFNTFNNFSRIGFNLGASQKLGKKTRLQYNYLLNSNLYSNFDGINYTQHTFGFSSQTILSSARFFRFNFRSNLQNGQEERRNFILLLPEIVYERKGPSSSTQFFLNYQKYSFENLGLRDSDRIMMGIRNTNAKQGRNQNRFLALSSKTFQNKQDVNYFQLDSRLSTNWNGKKPMFGNIALRVNYFPNETNLNFTDVQFGIGSTSNIFYSINTFSRIYYSTDEITNISDVNVRAGINLGGFRLGPTLSLHSLLDLNDFSFQQDGNFYRFGAYLEGAVTLPYQISISVMSAYDYGFVYSQQFTQNTSTGEIDYGDINERNPTTFQLNSNISTSVFNNMDLFFRLNFYIIDTDITAAISRDPIQQNNRFTSRLGARYRFN